MISKEILESIKKWFYNYTRSFFSEDSEDPDLNRNIDIKIKHSLRVCNEITDLSYSLNLSREECRLAELIALLHDIGRFHQYTYYKTYSDLRSEDHAGIGVKVLKENNVLNKINIICSMKINEQSLAKIALEDGRVLIGITQIICGSRNVII